MRRTVIKWLHLLCVPLIAYFWLVVPEESRTDLGGALSTHAGVGMILGVIVAHTLFHLWRHYLLKDNALRIMVPRHFHKYLK